MLVCDINGIWWEKAVCCPCKKWSQSALPLRMGWLSAYRLSLLRNRLASCQLIHFDFKVYNCSNPIIAKFDFRHSIDVSSSFSSVRLRRLH